jgi:co-chaperonin GroES (HSP10)
MTILTPEQRLILPPGMEAPQVNTREEPNEDESPEERAKNVPDPTGYHVLCMVPPQAKTFDGSQIVKADSYIRAEESGTTVLFVLKLGPDAYKDTAKFPSGPWCKERDFVLVRTYSGTRFKVFGREFRLLNDDQIDAVVQDPRGITRFGG